MRASRHRLGHVAERDQAERLAVEPRDVLEVRAPLGPLGVHRELVHEAQATVGGEEHGHGVIGHLIDEHVGHVGDDDAGLGGRVHVHRVGAHAAQPDHLAVLEALDDGGGDAAIAGNDGVGVLGRGNELFLGLGWHLDDLGPDGIQRLALDGIGALAEVECDTSRRLLHDDLELSLSGWHACVSSRGRLGLSRVR